MVPDAVESGRIVITITGGVLRNACRGGEVERERATVGVVILSEMALVGVAAAGFLRVAEMMCESGSGRRFVSRLFVSLVI
jgi:adenosylcobinamide amidohydrolase